MREGHQVIQTEGTSAALDRVHGPENGIDRFRIVIPVIHFQKTGLQFGELPALLEKISLISFISIGENPGL